MTDSASAAAHASAPNGASAPDPMTTATSEAVEHPVLRGGNPYHVFRPRAEALLGAPQVPDIDPKTVAILAFDDAWHQQGLWCIESLKRYAPPSMDIVVLSMGLSASHRRELQALGCRTLPMPRDIAICAGAPSHTRAMWARPYLRELVPGYNVYFWVDSDVRFLRPDSVEYYIRFANLPTRPVVITPEFDLAYVVFASAGQWSWFAAERHARIERTWGRNAAEAASIFYQCNAGLWAMHRDSEIWDLYREHLEIATQNPYDRLAEQDSMNLAILKSGMQAHWAPSAYNWICSMGFPVFNAGTKEWVRPAYPYNPLAVVHLTDQRGKMVYEGAPTTYGEVYKAVGLLTAGTAAGGISGA